MRPVAKSAAPPVRTFVALGPAPKPLAPLPVRTAALAVAKALAAERKRAAALLAITPEDADEEFRAALRRGGFVDFYHETLAAREVIQMQRWIWN